MPDRLAKPLIEREDWADGSIVLHNRTPLPDPLPDILDRWNHGVETTPEAIFVSERRGDTIHTANYAESARLSDSCACWLRDAGARIQDRVAVIAGAGIAHAVIKLAALKANLVHVPLSPMLLDTPLWSRTTGRTARDGAAPVDPEHFG